MDRSPPSSSIPSLPLPTEEAPPERNHPKLSLQKLNGKIFSYHISRPTLIHFWATWCATCIIELPSFGTLKPLLDRAEVDLLVIAIDTPLSHLQDFSSRHTLTFPLFRDHSREIRNRFAVRGLPVTILIDRGGEIVPFPDPTGGTPTLKVIGPRSNWGTVRTASQIRRAAYPPLR